MRFLGEAIYWRGPAPFVFVPVPDDLSAQIRAVAAEVTYGWGVIPANVTIGATTYYTALFPKDGRYLVPIKKVVQDAEKVGVGDTVEIHLTLGRER